jgi:hypothetical protein
MPPPNGKKRKATKGLLDVRTSLGEGSFSEDGVWGTLPAPVRPFMHRVMGVVDALAADFTAQGLASSPAPAKIEELHQTLAAVQQLRNHAEDALAGQEDADDKKAVVSAVFDRVQELAYAKLVACQSAALASGAKNELRDFIEATQTSLEQRAANNDEDDERAALPAFIKSGRLTDIQKGRAEESNRFTDLLLYVQFNLRSRELRRRDDRVFSRIRNSEGLPTAAWADVGDIARFIHGVCRKEINPRMWAIVAQPSDPVSAVVRYFSNSDDPEFPELIRDKSTFSFDNGVYMAATNEFLSYDSGFDTAHPLYRGDKVPGKHFQTRFPVEHHQETLADPGAWRGIPTPHVEGLFSYQEIPPAAVDMMYVTVGRMLHDVGKHDTYGYVGMIVGAAGTGKSTFCMHLTKLWEAEDVGVLSNNCERQFALYPFMNKFLFVAPEVKRDFKLDQAEWQGITTGDPMSCAVKFQAAKAVRWTTPGFFAGNEIPDWVDHGGSVLRRLLVWRFDKRVAVENGNLPKLLEEEIPAFVLKCAAAYLDTIRTMGNAAMWTWVDGYFWEQRRRLTAQLNPLESFIHEKLLKDPRALMPFEDFKRNLREFCKENGFDTYRMSGDTFTTIFSDHGLRKTVCAYKGDTSQPRMIECVTGGRMRTEDDNLPQQDECDES